MSERRLSPGQNVAIGVIVVLDVLWLLATLTAIGLVDSFDYGGRYDAGWRMAFASLVAAAPIVILVRSRGQRLLLAWGVLLAGALLLFGVCLAGA